MTKVPLATFECRIPNVDETEEKEKYAEGTLDLFGSLQFGITYCRKKEEGNLPAFLSLFLRCIKNKEGNSSTNANEMDMGWGKYDVIADLHLLATDRKPRTGYLKSVYSKESWGWGKPKFIDLPTLLNPANGWVVNKEAKLSAKIYSIAPWKASTEEMKIINGSTTPPSLWLTFLESGIGSDVTFIAKDNGKVKANSGVLVAASPVFKAMFEAPMEEARRREVRLDDMSTATAIQVFLRCLYTGSLGHLYATGLRVVKEVINAAEKYGLDDMKKGAGAFLPGYISPRNVVGLVQFAKRYGLQTVEKTLREYIKEHLDAVVDNSVTMDSD